MSEPLDVIRKALDSCEYRCPGGHRLDGVRGDQDDFLEEMMDEMGMPADWDAGTLSTEYPKEWQALLKRMNDNWVEKGRCDQSIEITMEYEGEYGEISYPVADGPCVAALGMDMDEEYDQPLWVVAFERRRLRKILISALHAAPDLEIVS